MQLIILRRISLHFFPRSAVDLGYSPRSSSSHIQDSCCVLSSLSLVHSDVHSYHGFGITQIDSHNSQIPSIPGTVYQAACLTIYVEYARVVCLLLRLGILSAAKERLPSVIVNFPS
ncbi:unnamed protein product, partial [Protopolystoma xenopodis]